MLRCTVLRDHHIEHDRGAPDPVMERRGRVAADDERVVVYDLVRPVIDLLTIVVIGVELAVGPECMRVLGRRLRIGAGI